MKTRHPLSGLTSLFMSVLMLTVLSCSKPEKEEPDEILIPVRLQDVHKEEISNPIHISGRIASKKEMKLSFKIGGIIEKIFMEEGREVRAGQPLARLNLSEIEAQVKQAGSAFAKADRDLERVGNLFKEKAATLEQFQNVQTAHEVAKSRLGAAEFNLRFAEITAPSRGRILKRMAEEHELVGAGMPVFFFGSTDSGWVIRAGVSEVDIVRLNLGDSATLSFDAYPDEQLKAEVSEIVEAPDPLTGTYEVELQIGPTDKRLISGFVAKVDILPRTKFMRTVIPVQALVQADGSQGFVFTVDSESRALRIPVLIDFILDDKIALAEGLENISRVVIEGGAYLRNGDRVKIIENRP
jgi:multidrug efflux system membrane fusion protein